MGIADTGPDTASGEPDPIRKASRALGLLAGLAVLTAIGQTTACFSRVDAVVFDLACRARSSAECAADIALILIDDSSLESMNPIVGRWPWPRAIYSDLLEYLAMGRPRAVLMNILFTENQGTAGEGELSGHDRALVVATGGSGIPVYHAMQLVEDVGRESDISSLHRSLPEDFVARHALPSAGTGRDRDLASEHANTFYLPFPELYRSAAAVGMVQAPSEADGVYRKLAPVAGYQGHLFPALGIAPFVGSQPVRLGPDSVTIAGRRVPGRGRRIWRVRLPKIQEPKRI